jgi:hypothetical protein
LSEGPRNNVRDFAIGINSLKGAQKAKFDSKAERTNRGLKPLPQLLMIWLVYDVHFHNNWWKRHLAAIFEHFEADCIVAIGQNMKF